MLVKNFFILTLIELYLFKNKSSTMYMIGLLKADREISQHIPKILKGKGQGKDLAKKRQTIRNKEKKIKEVRAKIEIKNS